MHLVPNELMTSNVSKTLVKIEQAKWSWFLLLFLEGGVEQKILQ